MAREQGTLGGHLLGIHLADAGEPEGLGLGQFLARFGLALGLDAACLGLAFGLFDTRLAFGLGFQLPLALCLAIIAASAWLNVFLSFAFPSQRLTHSWEAALQLGFDTRFLRTWEFYLAYCEAAFSEGSTDVLQFTLRKPD